MKNITTLMGYALAAVLMSVAASAQALESNSSGKIVVDNTLYSPINVKVSVKYKDDKGNIKSASATSKDLLKDLGFNTGQFMLCLSQDDGDVYVVNKQSGAIYDISGETNGMTISTTEQLYTEKYSGKNNSKYSYDSEGQITLNFTGETTVLSLQGLYSAKLDTNYNDKKGNENIKNSVKSMSLSGVASVAGLGENLPASGTANGSGNGTLTNVE